MALDGIVLSNIVYEMNELLVGGRIDKIAQPEKDELIISIRSNRINYKLLLSAQASNPRMHITEYGRNNPMLAPSFCMILRKYINNGKILRITQPSLERIAEIDIEHLNELGDVCYKILIIEIMGRHSNIILCDENHKILDSIKHVTHQMSSVREVYPGINYILPPAQDKKNLLELESLDDFIAFLNKPLPIQTALYQTFIGLSPVLSEELCYTSKTDSQLPANSLAQEDYIKLYAVVQTLISNIQSKKYQPRIVLDSETNKPIEFYSFPLTSYTNNPIQPYESISTTLDRYYEERANSCRINQKSFDIRKLVKNNIERCSKKLDLQTQQLKDTDDREKFRIKGELIHANIYQLREGDVKAELFNFYTNENEIVTLDPSLTPSQNAVKYFNKYTKKKRTFVAVSEQVMQTKSELDHLESIAYHLELASSEEDLIQIKNELIMGGYIRFRKSKEKKNLLKSEPLHYLSSDGFHIYVGKNNLQNEELTLKFATSNDWWFHAKGIPGSHVIVKSEGKELTDQTFEEASSLAAYYSKGKDSPKVEVDYTLKKNIKKPQSGALGTVIYHTNYSLFAIPRENHVEKVMGKSSK